MNISEKSIKNHKSGYNCAQSVFGACSELVGIDDTTAFAIGSGFGGGVRCGEICGAISGAVMALGAFFALPNPADGDAKEKSKRVCAEFVEIIRKKYGAITCRDLKSPDHLVPCEELIAECSILAEKIISENIKGE